jgi:hypothetical protein
MADERLEQLSEVEDSETTLRDNEQGNNHERPRDADGTVELSASDIVAIEPADAETTQVIERSQLQEQASADATAESLRTTAESAASSEMTFEHRVPEELLEKTMPKTQKMQAVGTQPLPRVDETAETDDPEQTAVRSTDSGEWAELDDEGFYTFIARVDGEGCVKLPEVLFEGREPGGGVMVFVRAKAL